MINKIKLENFQAHKKTVVDFLPGVNCIVGKSDSGKTAIFRGLKWVAQNRPLGNDFVSHWADSTSVSVSTKDAEIKRKRSKTDNQYFFNADELKAFGTDVPVEVLESFSFHDVNLQQQLDAPFLLSQTPGEIAKYLNDVANLDVIDSALQNIQSTARTINSDIKTQGKNLETLVVQKQKYDWLGPALKKFETAETMQSEIAADAGIVERLNSVVDALKRVEVKELPKLDTDFEILNKLIQTKLVVEYEKEKLEKTTKELAAVHYIDAGEHTRNYIENIGSLERKYGALCNEKSALWDVAMKVKEALNTIDSNTAELEKIKPLLPVCSECGQVL
jgi:exonuclease SbcC